MEYITSKNIFLLMRDMLKLIDRRPMDHGSKVGYLMYKMLACKGGYEEYELADFLMLATLHDIGAYKTDGMGDRLNYEFKDPMPHSVYGFLFLKNISPLASMSKMLLYHRVSCNNIPTENFEYGLETEVLSLAEAVEFYFLALGEGFDHTMFRRQEGTLYSKRALDLLDEAVEKYDVFSHLDDDSYQVELDNLLEYMHYTNEDKKKFMEMIMYCIGFRSELSVVDEVTSLNVSLELAEKLNLDAMQKEKLYYASLIHDVGMLAVPTRIIEAPRKLSAEETEIIRKHVEKEEKIFQNRMNAEIVTIATAHHERMDGSGYPLGLKENQMTVEQYILQVADVVTALTCKRSYRPVRSKDEVIEILNNDASEGKLNSRVVEVFTYAYDEIMKKVEEESKITLAMYDKLREKYKNASEKFAK